MGWWSSNSNWSSGWQQGSGWQSSQKWNESSKDPKWSDSTKGASQSSWNEPRESLDIKAVGILVEWQDKGPKSFGWISPIFGVPKELEGDAKRHDGDIYVACKDIDHQQPGAIISFSLYKDGQGLGAEKCKRRSVLRFVLPTAATNTLNLPKIEEKSCVAYLRYSVFFPEMEERNLTLRKYLYDAPLTLYELWGEAKDIEDELEKMGILANDDVQILLSRTMAATLESDILKAISDEELPYVPARFRIGLMLAAPLPKGGEPPSTETRLERIKGIMQP
mmetsp:Transcript_10198/g.22203  ORF Transcript_10198/g.22203 Transcript_10198/m.22203 type:complete len:278 (+) Transcript_10198:69-902(+)